MSIAKTIARNFILPAGLLLKADKYFLGKTKKKCCIINFHGVRKHTNEVFNNRHMPVQEFEKTIKYLKDNYVILTVNELFEIHRQGKKVNRKTIALTFDDGYMNNFEVAFPILKKYNVPATFYIISKGLMTENYLCWPDIIDLLKKHTKEDIKVNNHVFKHPTFYNEVLKVDLLNYLKTCGDKSEPIAYELLMQYSQLKSEIDRLPELVKLVDAKTLSRYSNETLLEFGSHTHSHFNLEYLNKDAAIKELKESKEIIERFIEKPVITLAFPDGSYNKEIIEISKASGYINLAAVDYKLGENNSDLNVLSRFTMSNSTTFESNALRLARQFDKYGLNQ